jgi:hypothetical protein
MILGELGEAPNSLVDIFFLYQIFRDTSRIFQARVTPKLGELGVELDVAQRTP